MPIDVPPDLLALSERSRFPVEAFIFIQRGLDYTVRAIHGDLPDGHEVPLDPEDSPRHVSGRQLCHGLRAFAIQEYGLMAGSVMKSWGVRRCEDWGRVVFEMVESGVMHKTADDTLDDFAGVFDFREAFSPRALTLTA